MTLSGCTESSSVDDANLFVLWTKFLYFVLREIT